VEGQVQCALSQISERAWEAPHSPLSFPTAIIFVPFGVLFLFPLLDERVCFPLLHSNRSDRAKVQARLSLHGPVPGARPHNQQITLSPWPAIALRRPGSINCTVTSHLGHLLHTDAIFQENIFTFKIQLIGFFPFPPPPAWSLLHPQP
jgi:hypothetical protein